MVLVVDDDETIREVIADLLEEEDYLVSTLESTKDLEKELEKVQPDCILMDVMLPGEDGDVVTKRLKQHETYQTLPIMLMSANGDVRTKAAQSQADGYLQKPFETEELLGIVQKYTQ